MLKLSLPQTRGWGKSSEIVRQMKYRLLELNLAEIRDSLTEGQQS